MKYLLPLFIVAVLFTSCSKNKKDCWQCYFNTANNNNLQDTSVCNMTEDESKAFQQAEVKRLTAIHGTPQSQGIASACHTKSKN